jgi:YidC/Oxa1 family membrane protein insertase
MNELDPLNQGQEQQRRLMLGLFIALGLTAVYMFVFPPNPQPPQAGGPDAGMVMDGGTAIAGVTPPAPTPDGTAPMGGIEEPAPPPVTFTRERQSATYTFSNEGAGLTSAVLKGEKMREQPQISVAEGYKRLFGGEAKPAPQMNLAQPVAGQPLPLAVSIQGASPLPADTRFRVDESATPEGGASFTARRGPWEVTKSLQWPQEGFELVYTLQVRNVSQQPQSGELQVHYSRAIDPENEHAPSFFGGVGNLSHAACHVGETLQKLVPEQSLPEAEELRGPVHFFGIDQQYFLSALYPLEGPRPGACSFTATKDVRSVTASFPLSAGPGETVTMRFGGYFGPKDVDFLAPVPGAALQQLAPGATFHPPLEQTIDYGWWAAIAKMLVWVMKRFNAIFGNWGVAIILLTVLVKLILLPLTHRSMVSMEAMKKLQPRVEEIRKKYAEDRERQNMEMMRIYQEAKVNPLGGCLPLLIQMPVWIALFTALRNSYDIYQEPFFGPIWRDLTYKDPTYLLPLALGVSMVITQRLQPQMGDPMQAKIMTWFVPILFTATLFQYPAGLSLYIFTNNILSIAQQYGLRKWLARKEGTTPAPASAGSGGKRK